MTPVELAIFIKRVEAICQEMGIVLRHAAFSPNIKDRLDFSCALFDARGELFAQAAHIPVHLGSMAYAMHDIVSDVDWLPGDVMALNDPFMGGTHLPDVTLVSPFFVDDVLLGFVANRAHHANIGAVTPGSMPVSRSLDEEGLIISPVFLSRAGKVQEAQMLRLSGIGGTDVSGDFAAQRSANRVGLERLSQLVATMGSSQLLNGIREINQYGTRLAAAALASLPHGRYEFTDVMDDDGFAAQDLPIHCRIDIGQSGIAVDFSGTAEQVPGNINCPLAVAAAAVFYAFRCLLPDYTPACAGTFSCVSISAPEGTLVNAKRPAAVAAGNVETSMRIVDTVLGALAMVLPDRIPAASQGTMNNIAMGNHSCNQPWDYYETIGGGSGAHPDGPGVNGVQSHMTNTLNTPIESLEMHYPVRVRRYALRHGSGGIGKYNGGNGLIREYEFLEPAEVTLLTERRRHAPWGRTTNTHVERASNGAGRVGRNYLDGEIVPGKCQLSLSAGQILCIESPGGGAIV